MNYLIWKGLDSREINGLVICELPPISKPQMRVAETVIDGVDGSIIEEVGYSSYDKTLTIGLTRNADIDEVIGYFTGNGDVVFSNEEDKYYKATIVGQIDYARLVRFRTANVVFRAQPFKYEYQEKQSTLPSGEVAGEVIQLEDKKITELAIEGRSIQNGTPTPDAPIEIENIGTYNEETKKYEIEVKETGKNKLVLIDGTYASNGITATVKNGIITLSGTSTETSFVSIKVKNNIIKNGTYILSINNNNTIDGTNDVRITDEVGEIVARTYLNKNTNSSVVFTYSSEIELNYIVVRTEANVTYNNFVIKPQIEKGTTATEWQIGKTNTPIIMLEDPLRGLPSGVKDVAYIENNKLYVDRYIESIVLDGSDDEDWTYYGGFAGEGGVGYCYQIENSNFEIGISSSLCSHFKNIADCWRGTQGYIGAYSDHYSVQRKYFISDKPTLAEWKSWLNENPVEIVYKAQPNTETVEIATAIELVDGINEIANSENANMVISYVDSKMLVNNIGNHIAKPVMEIEGSGAVTLAVNGDALFRYTFPDGENTVIIDSQKQDAYLGSTLKNRNMSGEFPVFKVGKNTITWEGNISSIKISSKSRWL